MDLNFIKTVIKKALQNKNFLIRMAAMVILLLLKDMFGNSIIEEFVLEVEDFTPSGLLKYMKKTMFPPKLNASDKLTMASNSNVNHGSDTINEKTSLNGLRILHNISDFLNDEQKQRMENNIMNFISPKISGTQISNNVSAEMNASNSRNCEINSNVVSTNIDSPLQMKITGGKGEFLSKIDMAECKKTNSGDIVLNYYDLSDIENNGERIINGITYTETEMDRIIRERDSEPIELMYSLKNFHDKAEGALEEGELDILKEIVSSTKSLSDTNITEPTIMNNIIRGSLENGVYSCNNTTTIGSGFGDGYFGNMKGEILIGNKGDAFDENFCKIETNKGNIKLENNDLYYMKIKNEETGERILNTNKIILKNFWDTFVTRLEIAWEKRQDDLEFKKEKLAIIEGLYYVDEDNAGFIKTAANLEFDNSAKTTCLNSIEADFGNENGVSDDLNMIMAKRGNLKGETKGFENACSITTEGDFTVGIN